MATIIRNAVCASWAYSQADLCADTFRRFGFWTALLMLFICFFGNSMVAAWLKHR